jgi:hypothetical protein
MAGTSYTVPARLVDGKYIRRYRASDGTFRTEILEDEDIGGVSTITVANVVANFVVEDMSTKIATGVTTLTTDNDFSSTSICVYFNGMNITSNITVVNDNSFSVDTYWANLFVNGNDTLLAVYFTSE